MQQFKVALLQMSAYGADVRKNQEKAERFCREARALGVDVALFPEMWNVGYEVMDGAGQDDAAFVAHFQGLAIELKMAIAVTYLEQSPKGPRNAVSLIDRTGKKVLTYAKVHTCDFDLESTLMPGDDFHVATLDTESGPVSVGAMICYDREFPESARILMLKGAEILLIPNACPMDPHRVAQLHARAFENMVGVALCNYAGPPQKGRSIAFDAVCYNNQGYKDNCLVEGDAEEGIFIAEFDMDAIRQYRKRETWGDAYRKPAAYGLLVENTPNPPFVRADAKR